MFVEKLVDTDIERSINDLKSIEIETQKKELESKDNRIRELEEKLKVFTK
jgi:hypothetical protein